ncbi:MAG: exopolyphosphatase [Planctomycetes bacterium]|nr:exopolyphosphatase [Planctomycetota bacterium]
MKQKTDSLSRSKSAKSHSLEAVIELGTSSVRMAIAQIEGDDSYRILDYLQQPITIGRDSFSRGSISAKTTELCVQALNHFRTTLTEYNIDDRRHVTAVATSAVREASNKQDFLDRICIGTGIPVVLIDEAEVNRYTYLAARKLLATNSALNNSTTLVVEIGGGSTETILLKKGAIVRSLTYRLGSLRLRRMIENSHLPGPSGWDFVSKHIDVTLDNLGQGIAGQKDKTNLLVLGGEARFAAKELGVEYNSGSIAILKVRDLDRLRDEVLGFSTDDLVRKFHLTYIDAETLGPSLLMLSRMSSLLGISRIHIGQASLRDGILSEKSSRDPWQKAYREQIISSAMELGQKYVFNKASAEGVADLSMRLYHLFHEEHRLQARYGVILQVSALLRDIGLFVSNRSHHKHSMYLIQNSDLFGLGSRELLLCALVARYHRRATPRDTHEFYGLLPVEDKLIVKKLSAILRVADALLKGGISSSEQIEFHIKNEKLLVSAKNASNIEMEQLSLQEKVTMFKNIYGVDVELHSTL